MRVLVTGTSGFVGGAVASWLCERGVTVTGLSRRTSALLPPEIEQVPADLAGDSFLDTAARWTPCDAVVHCAACRDFSFAAREVGLANCVGTQQTLALAKKWGAYVVFLSGVFVYGRPLTTPVTEEHPLDIRSDYAASKMFGEYLVRMYGRAVSLRVTAPVGAHMPEKRFLSMLVARAMRGEALQVHGTGSRRQNYVDNRDIGQAVLQCLESNPEGVFNLGGDGAISNLALAETCVHALGSSSTIALSGMPDPEDDVSWDISSEKACEQFGFRPRCSIEDSILAVAGISR